jgi:TolB-like protein
VSRLSELRDRRLVQIILAYGAAGWIVLTVFDQLADRNIVPELVYVVVLTWYLGGFFISAIIGWFHGEKGAQKVPPLEYALVGVVGILTLAVSGTRVLGYLEQQRALELAGESRMDLRRVAVRYFEDLSRDGSYQYLADGITEDLITELDKVRTLDVVSRNGVAAYRGNDVSSDSVARALGAGTIVEGSLEARGDENVRIDIRLVDGESGAPIQRQSVDRGTTELLALREEVAGQVSIFLREWLGEEVELRRQERASEDGRAWALVLRAERAFKEMEEAFDARDIERAEDAYQQADGLLEQAETLDPGWPEPPTLRAEIAVRRSEIEQRLPEVLRWIETGTEHVARALERSPNDAEALKVRGELRFARWRRDTGEEDEARARLLENARSDLEEAVELDPSLADGHYLLAYLYGFADGDAAASALAARTAYQEDAYLEAADQILWSLVRTSWDLRQLSQAQRWCQEGSRRFSRDSRFVICQLELMTTPAVEADPDRAWELIGELEEFASERDVLQARVRVAGVLGRVPGLADSARTVLMETRSRATFESDPQQELLAMEAEIRSRILGDYDEAIDLLKQYQGAQEGHALDPGGDLGWWWDELRDHPRFSELTGH